MKHHDNPHINPPPETTPEEAERNKRTMGRNLADRERLEKEDTPGTSKAVKTPDPNKATG